MSTKRDQIELYYTPQSAEFKAVLMTGKHLRIDFKLIEVTNIDNEINGQLKKLNPYQTLPTINDNGFILWESRAIMQYLVNKYFPNNALYPTGAQQRATINRLMFFDIGSLKKALLDYKASIFKNNKADDISEGRLWDKLKILNTFLSDKDYVAGNALTLADISIYATINDVQSTNYNLTQFRELNTWIKKMKLIL